MQPYEDDNEEASSYDENRPKYVVLKNLSTKESQENPEMFERTMNVAQEVIKQQLSKNHSDLAVDLIRLFRINKLTIKLHQELSDLNKSAQKIIQERLLTKTKRISTRTKSLNETSVESRFSNNFSFDNILLVKFINTLSILMLCVENSTVAPKMAKEICNLTILPLFDLIKKNIRMSYGLIYGASNELS